MEKIESQVQLLLRGEVAADDPIQCDFSLATQNEFAGKIRSLKRDIPFLTSQPLYFASAVSKGVAPVVTDQFRPVLMNNVTYIVCAVIINDDDEVLMVQEAKSSYSGTWYLPAGRMEPGETIEEAAEREVLEETGLQFRANSILIVECAHGSWVRFVLMGDVIGWSEFRHRTIKKLQFYFVDAFILGGKLKTTAEADAESLQAMWVANVPGKTLRSNDILPLIDHGFVYKRTRENSPWHEPFLPVLYPHSRQYMRTIIIVRKRVNNNVHVLVSEKSSPHLPICELSPAHSVYSTLKKFMQNTFPVALPPHKPHGILALEHCGKPTAENDGFCLTLLISVRQALEDVRLIDGFTWLEVNEAIGANLLQRMDKNMTVMLHVLR
uniref:Nudix hydrolase domain-containing protein n=1 Tax=Strigamia maritima TaxID=126957 RepID=T1IVJ6_STRMM